MFQPTTALHKICALTKKKRIIPGGTSAGKTIAILIWLISYAATYPRKEISVVSETIPHLRRGALKDFLKVMQSMGRFRTDGYNKSLLTYTFANGSYIEFFSADQEGRLTGARRDVLFLNEANNINWEAYHHLAIRTNEIIFIDFNPTGEFWVHTELANDPDAETLILTYLDNELLNVSIRSDIEAARKKAKTSTYWENWWRVYGLGQVGITEGLIYHNWQQIDDTEFPFTSSQYFAIDWGFTNSPTVLLRIAMIRDVVYVHEEIYQTGLSNADLIARIKAKQITREFIVADSEDPKSISELSKAGLNVTGSIKFPGYVNKAIEALQMKQLKVTKSSMNVIKELRQYSWVYDKKLNKYINTPVKKYDHALDAIKDLNYIISQPKRTMTQHN